jgi:hypothetical protein
MPICVGLLRHRLHTAVTCCAVQVGGYLGVRSVVGRWSVGTRGGFGTVRGGQKSLHVAAAQRHLSVVRVPVCVCVGGFSMLGARGRGHSHRCLLLSLSLSVCVCAKERDRQSQCTFSVVALGPAPLRPRPWACVVPGTVPGHALCVCPCACVCYVSVFLCGCVRPTSLCRHGGHGPACVCLCPCVCVRPRLSSFSWHGRGPLSPSLPHTLTHAVCGEAGGGIEGQLGRLKQQRVHCVGDKGPLGAVWMRRLRHAWGGHSEREGGGRVLRRQGGCRVCLSWRPSSTMRSKSARRDCRTMAQSSSMDHPCPLVGCGVNAASLWVSMYVCVCVYEGVGEREK